MWNYIEHYRKAVNDILVEYIDIDYSLWLSWLFAPLIITLLLPVIIGLMLYLSALILYIYKLHWHALRSTMRTGDNMWETGRKVLAAIWDAHGFIWHGYEITGMENIPSDGALLIYYHGAVPIDIYYFVAKIHTTYNRMLHTVADHFLFKVPGFSILADACMVVPGTIQSCSAILKNGNLLAIAPGGVYEAQFSQCYELQWKRRTGFAKVALEAKVPIVPIFTQNIRQAFGMFLFGDCGRRILLRFYAWSKLPCGLLYGGFPVKLVTHVGKPIPYESGISPEELQVKVSHALNELIRENQRLPGSIMMGLLERIPFIRRRIQIKKTL